MVKRRFMGTILAVVMAFASIGNFYNISKADENVTGQEKSSGNKARDLKVSDDSYNYESNEFTDKNVTAGTTYYYKVRGAMKYGSGYKYTPFSKVLSAKAVN